MEMVRKFISTLFLTCRLLQILDMGSMKAATIFADGVLARS
jgi:hypothetical protein